MNLTQYINQENPKRMPCFSVEVREDEANVIRTPQGTIVVVKLFGMHYAYVTDNKGNMYSIDDKGGREKASCFKLIN